MTDFDDVVDELKQKRDEARVQMHLASKEIQEEWNELEEFEERSAIMEFDGGLCREEADWRALRIIVENRPGIAI